MERNPPKREAMWQQSSKQANKIQTGERERERERERACFALLCVCGFVVVVVVVTVFCALLCFVLFCIKSFIKRKNESSQEFPRCSHPVLKMFSKFPRCYHPVHKTFPTFPTCSQRCSHIVWQCNFVFV